jgi:hypothetical protein
MIIEVTNFLVKIQIDRRDSFVLQEQLRLKGRMIQSERRCSGFTPINRNDVGRVDLYLFDVGLSNEELHEYLDDLGECNMEIQELVIIPADWKLVKHAGQIAEILLMEFPDDKSRFENLFQHVVHYSINASGKGYQEEFTIYRDWCKRIFGG